MVTYSQIALGELNCWVANRLKFALKEKLNSEVINSIIGAVSGACCLKWNYHIFNLNFPLCLSDSVDVQSKQIMREWDIDTAVLWSACFQWLNAVICDYFVRGCQSCWPALWHRHQLSSCSSPVSQVLMSEIHFLLAIWGGEGGRLPVYVYTSAAQITIINPITTVVLIQNHLIRSICGTPLCKCSVNDHRTWERWWDVSCAVRPDQQSLEEQRITRATGGDG